SSLPIFFLQAEDGIRVFHVTGVQTCALPISSRRLAHRRRRRRHPPARRPPPPRTTRAAATTPDPRARVVPGAQVAPAAPKGQERSEERRVGKEWRARWSWLERTQK